jgi:hypothetical protein
MSGRRVTRSPLPGEIRIKFVNKLTAAFVHEIRGREWNGDEEAAGLPGMRGGKNMAFMKKLLWWKRNGRVQRIRICVECGMPVGEHKEWCSILRTLQAARQQPAPSATGR